MLDQPLRIFGWSADSCGQPNTGGAEAVVGEAMFPRSNGENQRYRSMVSSKGQKLELLHHIPSLVRRKFAQRIHVIYIVIDTVVHDVQKECPVDFRSAHTISSCGKNQWSKLYSR